MHPPCERALLPCPSAVAARAGHADAVPPQADLSNGLPSGWEVRHSNSKNLPYYFHAASKESRWEPPAGSDTEALKTYMAAKHSSSLAAPHGGSGAAADGKIRAAHLLIKHRDSRRPSSWRESTITRSKEEAIEILRGHQRRIQSGDTTLGELATRESDCSSSRKGGDLGYFKKGDMQKAFEDAAFGLDKGGMSDIVVTDSGVHLIQRYVPVCLGS